MKKLLSCLILFTLFIPLGAQDFFREDFNREKNYIILVNPTVSNIKVVSFLTDGGLLDIDPEEISFVGVYHSAQNYDFTQSASYIAENKLKGFYLHEVRGTLNEENLFRENLCSDDFRMIFKSSAGIIFFGGEDIPPSVYGEENWYSSTSDPARHYFEVSFLFHLLGGTRNTSFDPLLKDKPGYLVTGFCLGMQTMNVAAGGSLYQDIPAQIYQSYRPETNVLIDRWNLHRNYWQEISDDSALMGNNLHPVRFTESSFFNKTVKVPHTLQPLVYSSHHQAIRELAMGFDVTALSADGKVVEGIASKIYPNVFAVQFHPEVSALYKDRAMVRFAPEDTPETLHSMIGRKSLRFHKRYWQHISEVIRQNNI
jgi:putative glutamine amidotransferase